MSGRPRDRCSWCGAPFSDGCPHVTQERTGEIRELLARGAELDRLLVDRRADQISDDEFALWEGEMGPMARILTDRLSTGAALDRIKPLEDEDD